VPVPASKAGAVGVELPHLTNAQQISVVAASAAVLVSVLTGRFTVKSHVLTGWFTVKSHVFDWS
jgi:hypothetical protein